MLICPVGTSQVEYSVRTRRKSILQARVISSIAHQLFKVD